MEYRRRAQSDVWHFHPKCRWWPLILPVGFFSHPKKPKSGEFCNECIRKTKRDATAKGGK